MAEAEVQVTRFSRVGRCNDVLWILLFVAQAIAIVVLGLMGTVHYNATADFVIETDDVPGGVDTIRVAIYTVLLCIAIAAAFSFLWMLILFLFSGCMIWTAIAVSFAANIGILLWAIFHDPIWWAGVVIMAIVLLLQLIWLCLVCKRIAFSSALLKAVTSVYLRMPMAALLGFLSLLPMVVYIWLWGSATFEINAVLLCGNDSTDPTDLECLGDWYFWLINVLLLISFFWGSQFVINTVFATSAGVVASWYFSPPGETPVFTTMAALCRSLTVNSGSIALGSLLIAIIKTIVSIVKMLMAPEGSTNCCLVLIRCCVNCCLNCLEWLAKVFNEFALVQVAVYGKPYMTAARDTLALLERSGVSALINESLVSSVLWLGVLLAAALTGFSGYFIAEGFLIPLEGAAMDEQVIGAIKWSCAVFGAFIGMVLSGTTQKVISAGVTSLFVCFAEEPAALELHHPELYEKFTRITGEHLDRQQQLSAGDDSASGSKV